MLFVTGSAFTSTFTLYRWMIGGFETLKDRSFTIPDHVYTCSPIYLMPRRQHMYLPRDV